MRVSGVAREIKRHKKARAICESGWLCVCGPRSPRSLDLRMIMRSHVDFIGKGSASDVSIAALWGEILQSTFLQRL